MKAVDEYGIFWDGDWSVTIDGEERNLRGHDGSDPGAFSYMLFDPVSGVGIVSLGNGDDEAVPGGCFSSTYYDS